MIINVHTHTFREPDIPRNFLPFGLVNAASNPKTWKILGGILRNIIPGTDSDVFDRYRSFVDINTGKSQLDTFEQMMAAYQPDTKFVVLPMDMSHMGAGNCPRPYLEQLEELAAVRDVYPDNVIPFVMLDPRQPDMTEILTHAVESLGFRGIKLYPPLGYYPQDARLLGVYDYAQRRGLPIMVHCSRLGPVHYRGSKSELRQLLAQCNTQLTIKGDNREMCSVFTHPSNYTTILKQFPKLRICLGHFGGEDDWQDYQAGCPRFQSDNWVEIIKNMLAQFPNLYTDVSYTAHNTSFLSGMLALIQDKEYGNRILYGSDYYMNSVECSELTFINQFNARKGGSQLLQNSQNIKRYLEGV